MNETELTQIIDLQIFSGQSNSPTPPSSVHLIDVRLNELNHELASARRRRDMIEAAIRRPSVDGLRAERLHDSLFDAIMACDRLQLERRDLLAKRAALQQPPQFVANVRGGS